VLSVYTLADVLLGHISVPALRGTISIYNSRLFRSYYPRNLLNILLLNKDFFLSTDYNFS